MCLFKCDRLSSHRTRLRVSEEKEKEKFCLIYEGTNLLINVLVGIYV